MLDLFGMSLEVSYFLFIISVNIKFLLWIIIVKTSFFICCFIHSKELEFFSYQGITPFSSIMVRWWSKYVLKRFMLILFDLSNLTNLFIFYDCLLNFIVNNPKIWKVNCIRFGKKYCLIILLNYCTYIINLYSPR